MGASMLRIAFFAALLMTTARCEDPTWGCSDSECECHPDRPCDRMDVCRHAIDDLLCWGPVVATAFTIPLPRDVVLTMIPEGLELGVYPGWKDNATWPVSFYFNQQHNIGQFMNYLEFMNSVAYLQWNDEEAPKYPGYRGPFTTSPKLFLDQLLPTIAGRQWGCNKETAQIRQECDDFGKCTYDVEHHNGKLIMHAEWQPKGNGEWVSPGKIPTFGGLLDEFRMPSMMQYPVNKGSRQCLTVDWYTDTMLVQPITGKLIIADSYVGNVPTGEYTFDTTVLDDGMLGAFRFETMWKFPQLPSRLVDTCKHFKFPNSNTST